MTGNLEQVVKQEASEAEVTGFLHLSNFYLSSIPQMIFSLTNIVRLDLGNNDLKILPEEIGVLCNLQEIWLNDNPLISIASGISKCKSLRLLDLRSTQLTELPTDLGRLNELETVLLDDVKTIHPEIREASENGTTFLLKYLKTRDTTSQLLVRLEETFREGVYRETSRTLEGLAAISKLTRVVLREFDDNEDIKNVIRNCDRLFPRNINAVSVAKIKTKFTELKHQNKRKKLAANLELRLRNLYFDRINPEVVEPMVKSIYSRIHTLADIQFIIKHASKVFPGNSEDVTAELVYNNMKELQERLASERAAAISLVDKALRSLYPHMERNTVKQLTVAVCEFFSKIEDLKKLAADASLYFPVEFEAAMVAPRGIRTTFLEMKESS